MHECVFFTLFFLIADVHFFYKNRQGVNEVCLSGGVAYEVKLPRQRVCVPTRKVFDLCCVPCVLTICVFCINQCLAVVMWMIVYDELWADWKQTSSE